MKTKTVLLLLFFTPLVVHSQDFRKMGIGLGYHTTSIVGDSVHPFELSFRYRINNKHTVQVYAPLWLKKDKQNIEHWADFVSEEDKRMYNHTWINSLWGIGLGYDYAFYSYSRFDFFVGINADFQWYESKEDYYNIDYRKLSTNDYYKIIETYYYWDRLKGISIIPNMGIRFVTNKITAETKLGLYFSNFDKKAYSFGKEKGLFDKDWMSTWQSYYPEKSKKEFSIRPNLSIHLSYYF